MKSALRIAWILVFLATLTWSAIEPRDRITWILEVLPAVLGACVLALTFRSFPLTPLAYALVLVHCIVLMVGGHYTYAEVPFFDGLFGAERNNYDKVGHFFQGFVPALLAREILIRLDVVSTAAWRNLFVLSFVLGFSAFYELIEWWVALLSDEAAEAFLGTQGYVWDTQSDMGWALLGGIAALLVLPRWHDRQLRRMRR